MILTQTAASANRASRQRFATTLRAELARFLRQGGMRVGLLTSLICGLLLGFLTILTIDSLSAQEAEPSPSFAVTVPVESAASVATIILALAVVTHTGRFMRNGGVQTSAVLVPLRRRLILAQFAAMAIIAVILVSSVSVTIFGLAYLAADAVVLGPQAIVGLVLAAFVAALMACLAMAIAVIMGSAVPALLVTIGWFFFAPVGLAIAGQLLMPAVSTWSQWTPALMQVQAITVTPVASVGYEALVQAATALTLFSAILTTLAVVQFGRRDL